MEPQLSETVHYQEREWIVTSKLGAPAAVSVGSELLARPRYATLTSADGPPAEITVPESEWHLIT